MKGGQRIPLWGDSVKGDRGYRCEGGIVLCSGTEETDVSHSTNMQFGPSLD